MLFKEPVHKQNNKSGKSYAQKCRCKYKKRIVQYHDRIYAPVLKNRYRKRTLLLVVIVKQIC